MLVPILMAAVIVAAVSYGGYLFWSRVFSMAKERKAIPMQLAAFVLVAAALAFSGGASFAQSDVSIDFDITPLFTSLNTYLPIFLGIFAIGGGIAAAMALSRYIISVVVKAFSGSL